MAAAKKPLHLYFSTKVSKPTTADDAAPKWNLLVPVGPHYRTDLPGGMYNFTPERLQTMVANWVRASKPRVRGDYFHLGGTDVPNVPLDNKIASGWAVDLKTDAHGLWALIDWTDKARDFILKDELASLSPEIYFDPIDRNTGQRQGPTLTSFGLLNDPSFQELPHVAAAAPLPNDEEETMDKKQLCILLGLAETATENEIQTALKAQSTALAEMKEQVAKLTATADEKTKLAAVNADKAKATSEETVKLAARVDALEKEKADIAVASLCSKLEHEGRIIASDKAQVGELVTAIGLEKAAKLTSTWPVKVKLGEMGHGKTVDSVGTKAEASVKFMAAVDALQKTGLTVSQAYAKVKTDDPELAKTAFASN